ncbi:hypothetical protein [Pararhizobium mangrovi]|uniref:HTH araC/xylS-type domain-containing protein n=1 Tax=Pararhizobium mangrovi TaxID=2590452 RepID=A0A506U0K6_9HYPH|nr:hypothetical protein [Pararhizobium mangrovi]TPW26129.1 hypothetical protein FJU11_16005 [Pararhizobium mangrovi]
MLREVRNPLVKRFIATFEAGPLETLAREAWLARHAISAESFRQLYRKHCGFPLAFCVRESIFTHVFFEIAIANEDFMQLCVKSGFAFQSGFTRALKGRYNHSPIHIRDRYRSSPVAALPPVEVTLIDPEPVFVLRKRLVVFGSPSSPEVGSALFLKRALALPDDVHLSCLVGRAPGSPITIIELCAEPARIAGDRLRKLFQDDVDFGYLFDRKSYARFTFPRETATSTDEAIGQMRAWFERNRSVNLANGPWIELASQSDDDGGTTILVPCARPGDEHHADIEAFERDCARPARAIQQR